MVEQAHVIVVGGGFAGLGCAHELAKHPHHARVTLIDRHDYHQFLPLLYQVATFQLAGTDVEDNLSELYKRHDTVEVVQADVSAADPDARSVTLDDGRTIDGDYLVLAAGSQANFFGTPGAEHAYPLYSTRRRTTAARPDPRVVRGCRTRPLAGGPGRADVRGRRGRRDRHRSHGRARRPRPRGAAVAVPEPCPGALPDRHRRRRQSSARAVLAQGTRLRLEDPDRPRRRDPARHDSSKRSPQITSSFQTATRSRRAA